MVELDGTALFHAVGISSGFLARGTATRCRRQGSAHVGTASGSGDGILKLVDAALLLLMDSLLLLLASSLHGRDMRARDGLADSTAARAHYHLVALAWLRRVSAVRAPHALTSFLTAEGSWLGHRLDCCAHGSGHSDGVRIVASSTFDAVTRRQESVKSLNQFGITSEKLADSANYTRSVDGAALKVLHYIEEAVVNVRVVGELDLDLIEIAQGIVEDRLLALTLALTLSHLLLLLRLRLSWGKRHEQS